MNTLIESLYRRAGQQPDNDALVGDHARYSYQSMIEAVEAVSANIAGNEVGTLALIADNGPEWIIMDLACQMAGCCFIPLPLFFTRSQVEHGLTRAGVDVLVMGRGIPMPAGFDDFDTLDSFGHGFTAVRIPQSVAQGRPGQTQKITFTSGSTGQPKGVCLSNEQQLAVADALVSTIAIERPRHLCVLPLATLLENIAGVYSPLMSGGSIHVPSLASLGFCGSSQLDVTSLLGCIDACRPETMILIPQLLDALIVSVMQGWQPPQGLKMIAVGGSRVAPAAITQARDLGLPVYEGYGLSECASVVSLNTPDHDLPGSAGRVLPHVDIETRDGEIHIIGNSFLGYLGEPDSWYPRSVATGDLGTVTGDGFIMLQGRRKNLLISSYGRNINPEWVESEVLAHPLISQCIVVGDQKPHCSALIHAIEGRLEDSDIQDWLDQVNRSLPDYAQVRAWYRLEKPLSSADDLLTENSRPRRDVISRHYATEIENLYSITKEPDDMQFFQRLQNETAAERNEFFSAPIIQRCLAGEVSVPDYVAFLTEAYHHVKHTTPLLMAVGARIPGDMEWLRDAVAEYIEEELGHQEWILNDIAACGHDKEQVRHGQPSMETELMVAYAYDMVARVNPLGFFGMVHVLEGSSVSTADMAAESIQNALNLPDDAFTYLRSHGAIDQEHVKFFEQLMNRIEDPSDQDCIIHSARVLYQLYGNIFRSLTPGVMLTEAA